MAFSDLFDSGQRVRNLTHFSSIVNLATADGAINPKEKAALKQLARKLAITKEDFKEVTDNPEKYPINAPSSAHERLERLYDILTIIFADHDMDEQEEKLLKRYAVALGFSTEKTQEVLQRSIAILSGRISFDDYLYLLNKSE